MINKDTIKVKKGRLQGQVKVSGAKNCGLKLLTASVLTDEPIELYNSPNQLLDMQVHIKMLNQMGKTCFENGDYLKIDRKSTRLNSSHVRISYAVFCLK